MAAVSKKRRVYRRYNDNNHPAVKAQNKRAKCELRRARRKFEKKLADNMKTNTKSFFAYIRSLSSSSSKPTVLYQEDGSKTSSPVRKLVINSTNILRQSLPVKHWIIW